MTNRGPAHERHVPIMRDRILDLLAPALSTPGAVHVDGTLGMGGHAEGVLSRFPGCRVIGVDRDREALTLAGERLAGFGDRFLPVHATNDELARVLLDSGLQHVDGIVFDLGVSSLQLDEEDRGFAYRVDAPLDMRMDQTRGQTAADVLNTYSVEDVTRILREYFEERFARKIAVAIVREREDEPFATSGRLVELLRRVIPVASQRQSGHPAKRTFQALRIEVNDELGGWERAVAAAIDVLAVGGRMAVLSFHSLEDRLTKRAFALGATSSAPRGLPVELPHHAPYLRALTRGAEEPDDAEVLANPRAASAKLRAVERVRDTGTSASTSVQKSTDETAHRARAERPRRTSQSQSSRAQAVSSRRSSRKGSPR
ncbi:16S rRNA (cytosine(1402)-N(4))-methyltransferase RsmH [Intrasporangium calvum]|uniref:16S rRNA (cytosine(1402)-N(4))-methyltransferase RsmH n=1 Tax=Intrasporangium calvum TaxID=53358 RepID=UPI000DF61995|nr:16S rRNA (cytosine(1402)-N(4))-methyltransferase RsmH [Intrasporangium calvum]AXG13112.1 16S rRNA (cytosine(1402)-N(4))-methyltransferase RsmH [Intrasporangium calvum]